jgi:hypothetical protein
MALTDKLSAEKAGLESYLDSQRGAKLEQSQIDRLLTLKELLDSGSGGTIVLSVFKAVGAGTGYSINDILILRQTPPAVAEYYNATTGLVVATPDPEDLGSVSSSSNVSVTNPSFAATQTTAANLNATVVFPSPQAVTQSGTWNVGVTGSVAVTGTFFQATQPVSIAALPALATGSNVIGSISNTTFGISGTLPAFAATPTFNIGTAPVLNVREQATPFYVFTATITRAANTTAYTANDVYGAAFELIASTTPPSGTALIITDIDIIFNLTALPSGMAGFTFYPYSVTPPSDISDNGAFSVPSGDRASILYPRGLSLGSAALAQGGGSVVTQANAVNASLRLIGTSLFGYIVTTGVFTPAANSETATIRVRAVAV